MGLEERQARPHRQDWRHQQGRPQIQGHRRPPAAPETPRAGPGILLRPASALHSRITDSVGLLTHALVTQAAASVDFLRELLELAQQVTAVEHAEDEGHLDEVSILPDPNVGALTQIFREYAPPNSPVIIENVVNDIDTIVRQ